MPNDIKHGTTQQREQDLAIRLEQADLRRAADRALRSDTTCRWIEDDTALFLSAILAKTKDVYMQHETTGFSAPAVSLPICP